MWLIGMMGSGKSTVAALAAESLGVPFHDTDLMVEESAGLSIAELWRYRGETVFRDMETAIIATVPDDGVAAAGGGAVLREENRQVIARSKVVIWLRCDPEELARRTAVGAERPLLDDKDRRSGLQRILAEREPLYESLATRQIDTTGRRLEQVVSEVIESWPG